MEQFLTDSLKTGQNVELSEALSVGGMVTGMGLGIVFSVLVILMIVLMLFKVIFYKGDAKKVTKEVKDNPPAETSVGEEVRPDDATVAAMVAAIAESTGSTANKIRIKSIRKIN